MAARVRERAARMPTPQQLADIAAGALDPAPGKHAEDMSPAEIRELVTVAIGQSQEMAFLLGQLAGLDGGDQP
jgi:hypothetical protein